MKNIEQILYEKYTKASLANLYIVNPLEKNDNQDLLEWATSFILKLTNKSISHEDIFTLGLGPDNTHIQENDYTVDDFKPLDKWLNFKPLELNNKICLIFNAEKISETIFNKNLKNFEEPATKTSFFLINNTHKKLLQTIESRAIKIRPNIKSQGIITEIKTVYDDAKSIGFNDFYAKYKNSFDLIEKSIKNKEITTYQQSQLLIEIYKLNGINNIYNNYSASLFFNCYNFLK